MRLTAWGARRLIKSALEAPTCDLMLIRRRMGIRRWLPSLLPPGLAVTPTTLGGVRCDWLTPRGARTDRAILYFHGGGYVGGSARSMRALAAWVGAAARTRVCAVDYRLAPEHPFPAAFDDAMAVYGAVLAAGVTPGRLALLGDSAGGGLAVAAMLAARDRGVPLPAAAALISPWLDLTASGGSRDINAASDDVLALRHGAALVAAYAGRHDPTQPYLSPLRGDLRGLPPMLVQVSTSEILLDDSLALEAQGRAAGVAVTCDRWEGLPHDWQAAVPFAPEARDAVRALGGFLDARLG
jgi:monoterpene epsilon-lactone hydrolase